MHRHPTRHGTGRSWALAACSLLCLLVAGACSLEVKNLTENHPPTVGEILMDPPPSALAPLDSFVLSISASDPDGDHLRFTWSAAGVGTWLDAVSNDSTVTWLAPASFTGVDTVKLSVIVRDVDDDHPVIRRLDVAVVERTGSLRVEIVDLDGNPAAVPVAVEGVETQETPASTHVFNDLTWGEKVVHSFATPSYQGARVTEPVFAGYPDTIFIQPDVENLVTLTVAPTSLLVLPGVHDNTLLTELQAGVDYCAARGLDSLLLWQSSYALAHQDLEGGGSAALRLDAADLLLAPFPGQGPVRLDAGEGDNDFGLYLAGRSGAMQVSGLVIEGAASSGVYLYRSSGHLSDLRIAGCGAAGVFLDGTPADTLFMTRCVVANNDHGVSLSGGVLAASRLLVTDSHWYGFWLRAGAAGTISASTVTGSDLAGIFLADPGALSLERCLLAGGGRGVFLQSGAAPTLACNLLWNNPIGDYGGLDPGASDLAADPLFCDPLGDDWRVDADSPALLAPCGPVGALGDCDSVLDLPLEGF